MAALEASLPDMAQSKLITVSSSIPISYCDSSVILRRPIFERDTNGLNSYSFATSLNIMNYSFSGARRRHLKPVLSESQIKEIQEEKEDEDEEENVERLDVDTVKETSFTADTSKLQGQTSRPLRRQLSFLEKQPPGSVPIQPRIHIKLMRAKSAASENDGNKENSVPDEEKALKIDTNPAVKNAKIMSSSNPDVSGKKGSNGYFKRVREMFRSRSTKSLTSLPIEDQTEPKKCLTPGKSILKTRAASFTSGMMESVLDNRTENRQDGRFKTSKAVLTEKEKSEFDADNGIVFIVGEHSTNDMKDSDSLDISDDSGEFLHLHRPSSYSLLKSDKNLNNPTTVNFTRIPSLRRREVKLSLVHHFTTVLPPGEDEETVVIKEATHIQPLENGESVVTDLLSNKIVVFDVRGFPKITFAIESGSEPWATCVTSENVLAVTLKRQGCVSLWSTSGEPIAEFGHNELSSPTGIQYDPKGRFVVVDEQANAVCIFNKHGHFLTELTGGPAVDRDAMAGSSSRSRMQSPTSSHTFFNQPRYICITRDGSYVIADSGNHSIKMFDSGLNFCKQFGSFGRGDGQFKFPYGVASDENGILYVADHYNNRISLFSSDGDFLEHLLTCQEGIHRPKSVAVMNRRLYVTHGDIRSNKVSVYKLSRNPH